MVSRLFFICRIRRDITYRLSVNLQSNRPVKSYRYPVACLNLYNLLMVNVLSFEDRRENSKRSYLSAEEMAKVIELGVSI